MTSGHGKKTHEELEYEDAILVDDEEDEYPIDWSGVVDHTAGCSEGWRPWSEDDYDSEGQYMGFHYPVRQEVDLGSISPEDWDKFIKSLLGEEEEEAEDE